MFNPDREISVCAALTAEDEFRFFATQPFNSTRKAGLARLLQCQFCSPREPIRLNRKINGQDIPSCIRTWLSKALSTSETTANIAQSRPRESCPHLAGGAQDMRRLGDSVLDACCSTSHALPLDGAKPPHVEQKPHRGEEGAACMLPGPVAC